MMSAFERVPEDLWLHVTEDNRREFEGLFSLALPSAACEAYGGDLTFLYDPRLPGARSLLYASYVVSREGIYSVKGYGPEIIAQGSFADALELALDRVVSDAIILTAGTLNAEPETTGWGHEAVFSYPHMRDYGFLREELTSLRASLGKEPHPPVYFMTNSGELNAKARIFSTGKSAAYILTNEKTAREKFPEKRFGRAKVLAFGETTLEAPQALREIGRERPFLRYEGGKRGLLGFLGNGTMSLAQLTVTVMPGPPSVLFAAGEAEYLFAGAASAGRPVVKRRDASGAEITTFDVRGLDKL